MKALRQTDLYTVVGVRLGLHRYYVSLFLRLWWSVETWYVRKRRESGRAWPVTLCWSYLIRLTLHLWPISSPSHCLQTRDIQLPLHGSRDGITLVTSVMRAYLLSLLQGKSPANLTQRFVTVRLRQSVRLVRLICLVRVQIKKKIKKKKQQRALYYC